MPRFEVKGKAFFKKGDQVVNDVFTAKNQKEAARQFNARIQDMQAIYGQTTRKPDVTFKEL